MWCWLKIFNSKRLLLRVNSQEKGVESSVDVVFLLCGEIKMALNIPVQCFSEISVSAPKHILVLNLLKIERCSNFYF